MSTFDYAGLLTRVQALMTKFGQRATLIGLDETAGNAAEPWKGPADVTAGQTTVTTNVVIVPPNTVRQFGLTALGLGTEWQNVLQKSEMIVIGSYDTTFDVKNYQELEDAAGARWGIIGSQELTPAETALLFFLGIRR